MAHVVLGVTGGIAAYKACELVRQLTQRGHEVRVILTESATRFVSRLALETLSGHAVRAELFDATEESLISHIELADWADVVLLAPATAHTLARLAHGLADDLLTTVCLASRAPLVVAPAMNVNMYEHAATQANLATLAERGVGVVGPERGALACGWEGPGRLADLAQIRAAVERVTTAPSLRGEVVLVTAGPTPEPIDPVRVITNRSSGKMGFALAEAAARRGAEVVLISGPVGLATPPGVARVDVETAQEMLDAVLRNLGPATIVIAAAAVADYRVAKPSEQKIKRAGHASLSIELVRNPDISRAVAERKEGRTLVGFAAETNDLVANATDKLARKGYDLIVANDVSRPEIGFDSDRNAVSIIGPAPNEIVEVADAPKEEVARRVLDRIEQVRTA